MTIFTTNYSNLHAKVSTLWACIFTSKFPTVKISSILPSISRLDLQERITKLANETSPAVYRLCLGTTLRNAIIRRADGMAKAICTSGHKISLKYLHENHQIQFICRRIFTRRTQYILKQRAVLSSSSERFVVKLLDFISILYPAVSIWSAMNQLATHSNLRSDTNVVYSFPLFTYTELKRRDVFANSLDNSASSHVHESAIDRGKGEKR